MDGWRKLVVRMSATTRRRMRVLAAMYALSTLLLLSGVRPSNPVQMIGVVLSILVAPILCFMLISSGVLPEEECSFCNQKRAKARKLVAAAECSICDECAALSMEVVAESLQASGEAYAWHQLYLDSMIAQAPLKLSRPLLELAADHAVETNAAIRPLVSRCFELHNSAVAAELLLAIPESARTTSDWINLGVALGAVDKHQEAAVATARALLMAEGVDRAVCLNNLVWYESQGPHGDKQFGDWIAQLGEAQTLLRSDPTTATRATRQCCFGTEAHVRRLHGDTARALKALDEAELLGPLAPATLLIRAQVERDAGDLVAAREDAEAALAAEHPEALTAVQARMLLDELWEAARD